MNTYKFYKLDRYDIGYINGINSLLSQLSSSGKTLSEEDVKGILGSDSVELYLLKHEEKVVGMFTLVFYITPTGRKCMLEDVVIDTEYRGKSLGRLLMQKVMDIVSEKGNTMLMLTSKPSRVAANRLYKSFGIDLKETNVYVKSL